MSDIEQFQQRINAAMDRLAYGLTKVGSSSNDELDGLKAQLEEEKTVTAQLEERLKSLNSKRDGERDAADAALKDIQSKMEALDLDLQKLRQANDKLRQANEALRDANAAGVGEPNLINAAVLAELESLRAARDVERAEADAILSALGPALAATEEAEDA